MTQAEFDRMPMLLRRAQIVSMLGINSRSFTELVMTGKIRSVRFKEGGISRFLKQDVARILNLKT